MSKQAEKASTQNCRPAGRVQIPACLEEMAIARKDAWEADECHENCNVEQEWRQQCNSTTNQLYE